MKRIDRLGVGAWSGVAATLGFLAALVVLSFLFEYRESLWGGVFQCGQPVPAIKPLGSDFRYVMTWGTALRGGLDQYLSVPNGYPPFVTMLYLPLTLLPTRYAYVAFLGLLQVSLIGIVFLSLRAAENPLLADRRIIVSFVALWTAILSQTYPVLFAMERGNADVLLAFMICLAYVALRHRRVVVAIVLLAAAVQLKMYALILVAFVLVRLGWKRTVLFVTVLAAMFLSLGFGAFLNFAHYLGEHVEVPYLWFGNHSVTSLMWWIAGHEQAKGLPWSTIVANVLLVTFAVFWVIYAIRHGASRRAGLASGFDMRLSQFEVALTGMAFCLMSLYPTISNDYKLPIHMVPFLLTAFTEWTSVSVDRQWIVVAILSGLGLALGAAFAPLTIPRTPFLMIAFGCYAMLAWMTLSSECPRSCDDW